MNIVQFLDEFFYKEDVQDIATFFGLSTTGKKAEIIKRIVTNNEFEVDKLFTHFSKDDLLQICVNAYLPVSGSKKNLWSRILTRFKLDMNVDFFDEPKPEEISASAFDKNALDYQQIVEEPKIDEEFLQIEDIIKHWIPARRYSTEEGYQAELNSMLEHKYGFKVQSEVGTTQVDILVNDNIPIELKKNPNRGDLDRLSGQIMRNVEEYGKLIVVICQLETKELFLEYKNRLKKRYSPEELIFIIKS